MKQSTTTPCLKTARMSYLSRNLKDIRKRLVYKVVEYHRLSTKRYLVYIIEKKRTIETRSFNTHLCFHDFLHRSSQNDLGKKKKTAS